MEKKIKIIETLCIIGIVLLAVIIVFAIAFLYADATEQHDQEQARETEALLSERMDYFPDSICYGQKLPVTTFRAADGSERDLNNYAGKKLMLLFWGSWCPYCDKVLHQWEAYETVLLEHPDYELLLIDKLDTGKGETIEKAQRYLSENVIPFECVFDEGLIAYKAYGVKRIPTLLILDEQGYLRYMTTNVPRSAPELQEMFAYVESGGTAATERFLRERMIGTDGGVFTTYLDKHGTPPTGHDVLSESQGILMEYAVQTRNETLFKQSWRYARENLYQDGVFAWYATEAGKQAAANALIDDLRIYRALKAANACWGGFELEIAELASAILAHNVSDGQLVGFYDFQQKRAGRIIPLCYIDMEALRDLDWNSANQAEGILLGGYISDTFPLYYSAYDYSSQKYSTNSMNTSEALMTLYQAVKAGLARRESLEWLERKVVSGTLAARYDVNGQVVKGFDYDSTAAYAVAALIGAESGNARLYTYARNRMEKYYVTGQSTLQGSFSDRSDGSDIVAFDQLMPLLVYSSTKDVVFDD